MDKHEVAAILDEIAILLELQGENPFRCGAYSKAARALAQMEGDLADVVAKDELEQIPGVGSTLRDKITELLKTGRLMFYEELKAKTPTGLFTLLKLPSIGPKKVKALYEQLGIDDLEKLKACCESDQIAKLKGFGAKTQEKILEGIAFVGQAGERVRLDQAIAIAETLVAEIQKFPGIQRLQVCGSLRRCKEVIKDIDILVSSQRAAPMMDRFVKLPQVQKIIGHGETKSSVMVAGFASHGHRIVMNADLRVVTDAQFPFALNYFTGSKEHNVAMRQRAIQFGLKLNEYELAGPKKAVPCREEADVYKALQLDYVPPELREDTGEIAAAAKHELPTLVEWKDLQGCFHNHSDWSDGNATLEEMARAAKKLGYKYLGIGDHSPLIPITNGLNPQRVAEQHKAIDALNSKLNGMHVFKGCECDIRADGTLDYSDAVLDTFDYVVVSVHSNFNQTQEEMTRRIIRAISNPRVTMLGHATGRLLLRREGYKVDLEAVIQAAAKHGTMIEINSSPHRLDIDWIHCKRAKALGVKLVINPDAHSTEELAYTRYGINVARRGWLEKSDVFNTLTTEEVLAMFTKRRRPNL